MNRPVPYFPNEYDLSGVHPNLVMVSNFRRADPIYQEVSDEALFNIMIQIKTKRTVARRKRCLAPLQVIPEN